MAATVTLRSGTPPGVRSPVGMHRERRLQLLDVREVRIAPAKCEIRELRNGDLVATGYASTFDEYEVYGGPENYGWIEKLDRKAFNTTLRDKPDVVYLVNHMGLPLARTKSGTLSLKVDDGGLGVEALLEKTDPDVLALQPKMARGDVDEMSFAFYVKVQKWSAADGYEEDDMSYRLITEVSIHRGDVSVVTFGANPNTHAQLQQVGQAGLLDQDAMDPADMKQALATVQRGLEKGATVTVDWAGNPVADLQRIVITRAASRVAITKDDSVDDSTEQTPPKDDGEVPAAEREGRDVALPEGDTISLADAKSAAGYDLSVEAARGGPPPPKLPDVMTLDDARLQDE